MACASINAVYFGYGPQAKLRMIRKSGEGYCPKEPGTKRHHCWAAAGHNFKSGIHFYAQDLLR